MSENRPDRRWIFGAQFRVWILLVALLVVTGFVAHQNLGLGNLYVSVGIGFAMAITSALFFMDLTKASGTLRLVSAAGILFLFILFLLSLGDYLTRPT